MVFNGLEIYFRVNMSVGYEESYWPTLGLLADMQFNLSEQISKEMHVKLRALHTDHEMYGFVKSVPLVQENLKQCSDFLRSEVKDERVAKKYRIKGNHHFAKNRMKEALNMYNACILHAPFLEKDIPEGNSASPEDVKGTSELALGFANRSAVLLNKKEYEACINDIQRALLLTIQLSPDTNYMNVMPSISSTRKSFRKPN